MRAKLPTLSLMVCLVSAALVGCSRTKTNAEPTQSATLTQSAQPAKQAEQAKPATEVATPTTASEATPAPATKVEMTTNKGKVSIELYPDKAPKTVANFSQYARDKFYDGTVFHRVIPNFMIQGGGFDAALNKKPTRATVQNEADNGLKNDRGTLAMARTPDPHSASAQFFINVKDNDFLNFKSKTPRGWGYTVFGKVTAGMDVVDAIAAVATGSKGPFSRDVPNQDVVIESIRVVE